MIIGVEGLPGAGKTTLVEQLPYPTIPEMLVSQEQEHLFSEEDYLEHDNKKYKLAQELGSKGVCLMDRTTLSSFAYRFASGMLNKTKFPIETGEDIHYIYLSLPISLCIARQSPGLWKPTTEFLERATYFYNSQFSNSSRLITTIDASDTPDEVVAKAQSAINEIAKYYL